MGPGCVISQANDLPRPRLILEKYSVSQTLELPLMEDTTWSTGMSVVDFSLK